MSPRSWKSLIRRAAKRAIAYASRAFDWDEWTCWIFDFLSAHGAIDPQQYDESTPLHFCLSCRKAHWQALQPRVYMLLRSMSDITLRGISLQENNAKIGQSCAILSSRRTLRRYDVLLVR